MKNNYFIYMLSFFTGFLSLSQEIIWIRLISFAGMSVPQTFSFSLAFFLIGIALGAQIGKSICENIPEITFNRIGYFFLLAGIVDILLITIVYFFTKFYQTSFTLLAFCILVCAMTRGIIFPIVHHVGTSKIKSGAQISNVYFANVFGSALAPILVSFVILDHFSTQNAYYFICFITLLVGAICIQNNVIRVSITSLVIISFAGLSHISNLIYILSKDSYKPDLLPHKIIENKHGFIQLYHDNNEEVVFGANVYDGKFNTDIFINNNGIDRAYLLASMKNNAENVLVIGLSTGSWVKVLSTMPSMKKMTIIEINPAYIEIIKNDLRVSKILKDERIEIVFDDGRKWLKNNKDKKFDLILMNTTWNWRAYASNLLSIDFLKLAGDSLNSSGIIFYNTTGSLDTYYTASQVFPYVYKYKAMALVSHQDPSITYLDVKKNLCSLKHHHNQQLIFKTQAQCDNAYKLIADNDFTSYEKANLNTWRPLEIITDDNMITEYKYGKGL